MLGIFPDVFYSQGNCTLEPGDVLVIFSDGLTEATNRKKEMYGEDRLLQTLLSASTKNASAILEFLLKSLERFTAREEQADDISLLMMHRTDTE